MEIRRSHRGGDWMASVGPPPYDDWHPPDPEPGKLEQILQERDEEIRRKWPGLFEEMERRLKSDI